VKEILSLHQYENYLLLIKNLKLYENMKQYFIFYLSNWILKQIKQNLNEFKT